MWVYCDRLFATGCRCRERYLALTHRWHIGRAAADTSNVAQEGREEARNVHELIDAAGCCLLAASWLWPETAREGSRVTTSLCAFFSTQRTKRPKSMTISIRPPFTSELRNEKPKYVGCITFNQTKSLFSAGIISFVIISRTCIFAMVGTIKVMSRTIARSESMYLTVLRLATRWLIFNKHFASIM